jgi:hypothetical protein
MITNTDCHTAATLRSHLTALTAERVSARATGLEANALYMESLDGELARTERAYVTLAVTEIATLRAELGDARYG